MSNGTADGKITDAARWRDKTPDADECGTRRVTLRYGSARREMRRGGATLELPKPERSGGAGATGHGHDGLLGRHHSGRAVQHTVPRPHRAASSCDSPRRPPPRCTRRALLLIALSTAPLHRAAAARAQPQQAPIDAQADEPPFTHQVFLDFELSDARPARVQIALYGTVVPQTVHNFLSLVDSHQYDGTSVYRIVPGLTVQLGDVLRNKGKSGRASTSSGSLPAENFNISHSAPGIVSMVVKDGMVDSRFFITTRPGDSRYLDGKYVAFARVVDGMDVLYRMEKLYARPGAIIQKPLSVRILRCARVEPQQ